MYKRILVPVDLGDPNLAKPALETAVMMANANDGIIRLINVLAVTPAMLAEYVPADFEAQQRRSAEEALSIMPGGRVEAGPVRGGAARRHLPGDPGRGEGVPRRPHRHELAPVRGAHLFPRLAGGPCGALRQLLGDGGAPLTDFDFAVGRTSVRQRVGPIGYAGRLRRK